MKVELIVDLIKFTFDGTIIRKGTPFNVEECEDNWTIPGESIPMFRIVDGEYQGKLLHPIFCKSFNLDDKSKDDSQTGASSQLEEIEMENISTENVSGQNARMNRYDLRRKEQVIKALKKAKEKADIAMLYLSANNPDLWQVADMRLTIEHIENALEVLGVRTNRYIPDAYPEKIILTDSTVFLKTGETRCPNSGIVDQVYTEAGTSRSITLSNNGDFFCGTPSWLPSMYEIRFTEKSEYDVVHGLSDTLVEEDSPVCMRECSKRLCCICDDNDEIPYVCSLHAKKFAYHEEQNHASDHTGDGS